MASRYGRMWPNRSKGTTAADSRVQFGEHLEILTTDANLPPAALSTLTNVSLEAVRSWFAGDTLMSKSKARRLARYLGLMGEEETRFFTLWEAAAHEHEFYSGTSVLMETKFVFDEAAEKARTRRASVPPPLYADDSDLPDPRQARTMAELLDQLRLFHRLAGRYSARDLAMWSEGAFSHGTVNALLSTTTTVKRPPLKLGYVQGIIRACGGDDSLIARWTSAWRKIELSSGDEMNPSLDTSGDFFSSAA